MRLLMLTVLVLCIMPSVIAFNSITTAAVTIPRTETRTIYLTQQMPSGQYVYTVNLDKARTEPILDISITGLGVGNFTLWLEPVGSKERYILAKSQDLVKTTKGFQKITGFVAGGGNSGNSNGNANGAGNPNNGNNGQGNDGPQGNANGAGNPNNGNNGQGNNGQGNNGQQGNAIGVAVNSNSKGIARRTLESFLNRVQGVLRGQERREAITKAREEQGIITQPIRFSDACTDTCSLPRPLMYNKYRLIAEVQGKLELHSIHYTVLHNK